MTDDEPELVTDDEPELPSSWGADETDVVERSARSRRLTIVAGGIVGVLVAALAVVAITHPFDREKPEQMWPLNVGGRPEGLGQTYDLAEAVTPDVDSGVYLWSDFDGWHLWFVFDNEFHAASGTITSNDDVDKAELTPAATGTVQANGKEIAFDLDTESNIAGIDFEPGFYSSRIEVEIHAPSGTLRSDMVHKGGAAKLVSLPIVVEQVDKPKSKGS